MAKPALYLPDIRVSFMSRFLQIIMMVVVIRLDLVAGPLQLHVKLLVAFYSQSFICNVHKVQELLSPQLYEMYTTLN